MGDRRKHDAHEAPLALLGFRGVPPPRQPVRVFGFCSIFPRSVLATPAGSGDLPTLVVRYDLFSSLPPGDLDHVLEIAHAAA